MPFGIDFLCDLCDFFGSKIQILGGQNLFKIGNVKNYVENRFKNQPFILEQKWPFLQEMMNSG